MSPSEELGTLPLVFFLARLREGWEKIYDEIGQIEKGPEDSLNLIKIKNPFGYLKTNTQAAWCLVSSVFFLLQKTCFFSGTNQQKSFHIAHILTTDMITDHIENTIHGMHRSWHEHSSYSELVSWCFCQVHLILFSF